MPGGHIDLIDAFDHDGQTPKFDGVINQFRDWMKQARIGGSETILGGEPVAPRVHSGR